MVSYVFVIDVVHWLLHIWICQYCHVKLILI